MRAAKRSAQKARSVLQKKFAVRLTLTRSLVVTVVVTVVAMAPLLMRVVILTVVVTQTNLGLIVVERAIEGMVCRVCTVVCRFAENGKVFELCLSQPQVSL